ncbi:MAG TPA: tRNA pseudouridine(55) synthase TruB, partial [Sphingomonadaceae bacterium]|nr:tRNA pseudouridine(55) synthase TruB [Sphingomonadaceae bacterium]
KLCGRMLDSEKTYEFTIRFGEETDTLDAEGEVVERTDRRPPLAAIPAVLEHFTGTIEQVPPVYSAPKVDGKRAYDRARAGEAVELKPRRVTVHSLEILPGTGRGTMRSMGEGHAPNGANPQCHDHSTVPLHHPAGGPPPPVGEDSVTLVASVSKGTYIRSLARDIAHALGTVGHVTYLRRIKAGPFKLESAISLDKLNEIGKGAPLEDVILPLEAGLDDIPALDLAPEAAAAVRQGRVLTGMPQGDGLYWAKAGNVPVALMELTAGTAKVVRGFNLPDVAE